MNNSKDLVFQTIIKRSVGEAVIRLIAFEWVVLKKKLCKLVFLWPTSLYVYESEPIYVIQKVDNACEKEAFFFKFKTRGNRLVSVNGEDIEQRWNNFLPQHQRREDYLLEITILSWPKDFLQPGKKFYILV